jgi:phenylalanyl-tRNA synthetase alpha chain
MDPKALETEALGVIAAATTLPGLEEVRIRFLGRKAELPQALREVRDRETGMALNALRDRLETAVAEMRAAIEALELERTLREDSVDVTLPGAEYPRGRLHLITQIRREVEDVFLGLGYEVVDGREVETTHYNFEGLNFPDWHPARSPLASCFFDENRLLRTETSSRSAAPTGVIRRTRRTRRCSTRSRGSRSTAESRSPTSRARCCT